MNSQTSESYMMVHFTNGKKQTYSFPSQGSKVMRGKLAEEIFNSGQMMIELENKMVIIPLANVLYVEIKPIPSPLPNVVFEKGKFLGET